MSQLVTKMNQEVHFGVARPLHSVGAQMSGFIVQGEQSQIVAGRPFPIPFRRCINVLDLIKLRLPKPNAPHLPESWDVPGSDFQVRPNPVIARCNFEHLSSVAGSILVIHRNALHGVKGAFEGHMKDRSTYRAISWRGHSRLYYIYIY